MKFLIFPKEAFVTQSVDDTEQGREHMGCWVRIQKDPNSLEQGFTVESIWPGTSQLRSTHPPAL